MFQSIKEASSAEMREQRCHLKPGLKPPGIPKPFTSYPSIAKFVGIFASLLALMAFLASVIAAGTSFGAFQRVNRVDVLAVDYDMNTVGRKLTEISTDLAGSNMTKFHWEDSSLYSSEQDIYDEVRRMRFWGAIVIVPDASSRFEAWANGSAGPADVNNSVIIYSWNSAYFSSWATSTVERSLSEVANTTLSDLLIARTPNQAEIFLTGRVLPVTARAQCTSPSSFTSITFSHYAILWLALPNNIFIIIFNSRLAISARKFRPSPARLASIYLSSALFLSTLVALSAILSAIAFIGHDTGRISASIFFDLWINLIVGAICLFSTFSGLHQVIRKPRYKGVVIWPWTILNMISAIVPPALTPIIYHWTVAMPGYNIYRLIVHVLCRTPVGARGREYGITLGWMLAGAIATMATLIVKHKRLVRSETGASILQGPRHVPGESREGSATSSPLQCPSVTSTTRPQCAPHGQAQSTAPPSRAL